MSTTIHCDACSKKPSPNMKAQTISVEVEVGNAIFPVTFTADIDLCHECRNEAIAKLLAYLQPEADSL